MSGLEAAVIGPAAYARALLADLLRRAGLRRVVAADGARELRQRARGADFDVVFVECGRRADGALDRVREIRSGQWGIRRDAPVILTADSADTDILAEARSAGIDGLLLRPISVTDVCQRVRHAIQPGRVFVESRTYVGPCRRLNADPDYAGPWRRLGDSAPAPVGEEVDFTALRPLFVELEKIVTDRAAERSSDRLRRLNGVMSAGAGEVAACGDPALIRIIGSAGRYLRGIGSNGTTDNVLLGQHFRCAQDYIDAPPELRPRLGALTSRLERRARRAISGVDDTTADQDP